MEAPPRLDPAYAPIATGSVPVSFASFAVKGATVMEIRVSMRQTHGRRIRQGVWDDSDVIHEGRHGRA